MIRDKVRFLEKALSDYGYYCKQRENSRVLQEKWREKSEKTKNHRYKNECIRMTQIHKLQFEHCTLEIRNLNRILDQLSNYDRILIEAYYIRHDFKEILHRYEFIDEGHLYIYLHGVLEEFCKRGETYYGNNESKKTI